MFENLLVTDRPGPGLATSWRLRRGIRCMRCVDQTVPATTHTRQVERMLVGIDTDKDTPAVAVIDDAGRPVVVSEFANTGADSG